MAQRSPITTHILDTAQGKPAPGIGVVLEIKNNGQWTILGQGTSDADGRVGDLLPADQILTPGVYRLTFAVEAYQSGFWPEVTLTFTVANPDQHYHVPLLISPFGYSTYRGS